MGSINRPLPPIMRLMRCVKCRGVLRYSISWQVKLQFTGKLNTLVFGHVECESCECNYKDFPVPGIVAAMPFHMAGVAITQMLYDRLTEKYVNVTTRKIQGEA